MTASAPPDDYAALYHGLHWHVPAQFNIAQVCCRCWARRTPHATAIVIDQGDAPAVRHSYAALQSAANRLSNALRRRGVVRGDRVAIVLPQSFEAAVAHIAVYQLGAVVMPLSILFGPEALGFRLGHGEARVVIAGAASLAALRALRSACPSVQALLAVGAAAAPGEPGESGWAAALARESADFTPVRTRADDPAVLIYTSGTTGAPKGALIPHRALIGNLSGFVCSQNGFPQPDAVFWSPADWAWTGGLMDALLPTLYFGRTIVGQAERFDPERAFALMQRHAVTHTFLFPTALKAMLKAVPAPRDRYTLSLRAVMSAGEAVGDAVFGWCRDQLGVTVNEMFGQTEINYVVGNSVQRWPARAGSMGRPYPGHRVAVIDEAGAECPRGSLGEVAVHRRDVHGHLDPVFFLGYWKNPEATAAKFCKSVTGDAQDAWCRTGDMATMDGDGTLWYQGRSDDMFKAAGYRIGPGEIENCLVTRPSRTPRSCPSPTPSAARSSRPMSCSRPVGRVMPRWWPRCKRMCVAGSHRTSTRRRSSSSMRCR
jgi:acetyl-CoA synthetase